MKHELTPEVISQIVDFAKKYEPKGDLKGIPREVISKMLQRQYEQQGEWDVKVFEKMRYDFGGFYWNETIEKGGFWEKTIGSDHDPDFATFFTSYPERFESEPQYRDSLGYPLEIGDDIYTDDNFMCEAIEGGIFLYFKGMKNELYFDGNSSWKYAISVKAYQNNPSEVMERIKQLETEPMKQEEKPTKPVYVTPCGTFTEGEEVEAERYGRHIFYKYDERILGSYLCVGNLHSESYRNGEKFALIQCNHISKIPILSIEEVASKAGISVEQLKEIVKEGK